MGLAKDGVYMPLKIDPLSPWISTNRAEYNTVSSPTTAQLPTNASLGRALLPAATPTAGTAFPWYGSTYYGNPYPAVPAWAFTDLTLNGDLQVAFQQMNCGHIVLYNLNVGASLTVKVRWGVEMRVEPTSILAPALRPSATHDTLAMVAYSDIAGSLPWAYPSEYNASGKIMDVIKRAWNAVRPRLATGLGFIPHPIAQGAGMLLSSLPDFERPAGTSTRVSQQSAPAMRPGGRAATRIVVPKKKPKNRVRRVQRNP
jgi:hypothetical protein